MGEKYKLLPRYDSSAASPDDDGENPRFFHLHSGAV